MNKYTYVIATSFPNGVVDSGRLTNEIVASSIVTVLDHIDTGLGDCDIWFAALLTVGEQATLDAIVAAHSGESLRLWHEIFPNPPLEPVEPGASIVVANDIPAVEIEDGITGFGAIGGIWPLEQITNAQLRATIRFILSGAGAGTNVRLALKAKSHASGEDSSDVFPYTQFVVVPVDFATIGEIFEGAVVLETPLFKLDDTLAVHVGRDGANSMGAGINDDVNQPIQIISAKLEAC